MTKSTSLLPPPPNVKPYNSYTLLPPSPDTKKQPEMTISGTRKVATSSHGRSPRAPPILDLSPTPHVSCGPPSHNNNNRFFLFYFSTITITKNFTSSKKKLSRGRTDSPNLPSSSSLFSFSPISCQTHNSKLFVAEKKEKFCTSWLHICTHFV